MKRLNAVRRGAVCWTAVLLSAVILCVSLLWHIKPFVFKYAKSHAETILLNAANDAIVQVIEQEKITYDGIAVVSRNADGGITGIEIDINLLNTLKSKISGKISETVSKQSDYDLYIPVGTLMGSEFTTGFGPSVRFKMRLSETAVVDFESNFKSTGINQALHQILIKIDISAFILMLGFTDSFSVSTTAVAAQTVIVGAVPDSFTNVLEEPGDDIADEIFNYADVK